MSDDFDAWMAEATPMVKILQGALSGVLSAVPTVAESPMVLRSHSDQLQTAANRCEEWAKEHPCPDPSFAARFEQFYKASFGISVAVVWSLDPEVGHRLDAYLLERMNTAAEAWSAMDWS